MPQSNLEIHLLGPFRVIVDGSPVDDSRWGRRKSKTLLKLLAMQPLRQGIRQMHREELIASLWPDLDATQGLNSFHKALHAARRALEPGLTAGGASRFLQTRDQLLQLVCTSGEVFVDVAEFEALASSESNAPLDQVRLEAALRVYSGDLLPEDLYEDWTAVRREQLRNLRDQLLLRLAELSEASGDNTRAIEVYRQLIASDPCNEAAHRGVMRLLAALGQRHLALEQFRLCRETLQRDLEVGPEPATLSLYEKLLAGAASPVPEIAPPAPAQTPTPASSPAMAPPQPASPGRKNLRWLAACAVLLVSLATASFAFYRYRNPAVMPAQFLAVMPLAIGVAGEADLEYMADGITESIINELSQLRQLRVMARTTVYRYRAKGMDPMAAAEEMKVQALLTGVITTRGDKILLAAELVSVPEGTRLWGNQYELTRTELISVQDRVASGVAAGLGLRLSSDDRDRLSPSHPTDPEAYRLYLQARYFWNQRSKEGYLKSIELFQAAIARDASYARAYAGLADSYSFLGRDEAPTDEYMPKARAAAERALALDPKLPEAHATLAMMRNVYDWNFPDAERAFQRAIELDPGYATTRLYYGVFLAARGRLKESQEQLDQAAEIDPLSPIIALCRGYPASFAGRIDAAIQAAQRSLDISPAFPSALEDLMTYYERQGKLDAALQQAVLLLHARSQHELADEVQSAYRASGYQAALRTWFEAERRRAGQMHVSPLRIAILAMRCGDLDKAYEWLDKAIAARNAGLVYLTVDPKYARLRSDPRRFRAACDRIGL